MPRGYVRGQTPIQTAKLDAIFVQLEQDILDDIARRLKATKKITSTADWQINRLNYLGNSSQRIAAMIQKATGLGEAEMAKLYSDAARKTYTRDADLYNAVGKAQVPFSNNAELQQLVRAISVQSNGSIENITRSTGFMVRDRAGRLRFTPVSDIYNQYLDQNVTEMLSGAFDYNTMIRKTVTELTNSGLRSVDYASGRSYRVDAAARMTLLTGYGQVTSRVTFANANQLGTDRFEVAWHPGARPSHQLWQGRVYTRRQLETVCGYGSVWGLCGANCRHVFYPWIEGYSRRQWPDSELARLDKQENTPKSYKGKDYTTYEATQQQRKLEANLRAYNERIDMFEMAGASEEDILASRAKFLALAEQYRDFSERFGLPEQWERVYTTGKTGMTTKKPTAPKTKPKKPTRTTAT